MNQELDVSHIATASHTGVISDDYGLPPAPFPLSSEGLFTYSL